MNASVDPDEVACQSAVSACESSKTCSAPASATSTSERRARMALPAKSYKGEGERFVRLCGARA
jgi:hypothetical protein